MGKIKLGNKEINKLYTGSSEVKGIDIGNTPIIEPDYLCFEAVEATNIAFSINGTLTATPVISYRVNNGSWTQYTFGNSINLAVGDKCYFKGNNSTFSESYSDKYIYFTSTGNVKASGNIMSLLDETCQSKTIPCIYCFSCLFAGLDWEGCTTLLTAPELPATSLTNYCYYSMFASCTSLTQAPELPATTLAKGCYSTMLAGCTSLTSAPKLPATTLTPYCYNTMLCACTSLTTAPELPATTLTGSCYQQMFYGCTSLTTPPELPAMNLAAWCYQYMFDGCTSLQVSDTQTTEATYAWKIPVTGTFTNETTYDQTNMFSNCLGTRSSNTMSGAFGESHTYYTQNEPI